MQDNNLKTISLGNTVLPKGRMYDPVFVEIEARFTDDGKLSKHCSVKFMKTVENSRLRFTIKDLLPEDLKILADTFRAAHTMLMSNGERLGN